jgi:rhodanese-related sulfurtransferase
MASSVKETLAEANATVPRLNPTEVRDVIGKGNALIVDVRDAPELAAGSGKRAPSMRHPGYWNSGPIRGPYHKPDFKKDETVLVYCTSGGRAALSGKTLGELGYQSV